MKLITTTFSKTLALALDVELTGAVDMMAGNLQINTLEVEVKHAVALFTTTGVMPGYRRLWVRPCDLCDDLAIPFQDHELIEKIAQVNHRNAEIDQILDATVWT